MILIKEYDHKDIRSVLMTYELNYRLQLINLLMGGEYKYVKGKEL